MILLCFSLYVVTSVCASDSLTYSHVRALVYNLVRHCFCPFSFFPFCRCGFRFVSVLNSRIVIVYTWLHLPNLIPICIGATRTSGMNFSGGSVGGLYTRLTVISPEPDFITTSRPASVQSNSLGPLIVKIQRSGAHFKAGPMCHAPLSTLPFSKQGSRSSRFCWISGILHFKSAPTDVIPKMNLFFRGG